MSIKYLKQYAAKKEPAPEFVAKVPEKPRATLNSAFCKAYEIIQGAMSYGEDSQNCFNQLDSYAQAVTVPSEDIIKE